MIVGFRLRALALLMFVAVAASAATAWLTLRQASRQVRESVAADQQDVTTITEELRAYALTHGSWDGVSAVVGDLARRTGQRVRVDGETGDVIADSDALPGRGPRPVGAAPPILVDPRPEPRLPEAMVPASLAKLTATAIDDYRTGVEYAACVARSGGRVTLEPGELGIPRPVEATGATARAGACERERPSTTSVREHAADTFACASRPAPEVVPCLRQVFARRTAAFGPPPLRVRLGALDETGPRLATAPAVAVATGVAAAAIAAALLLSRAVLRPVRALTAASRGLGEGDLGRRVPSSGKGSGKDEIAELGRAFNRMADSLQASEERQRRMVGDIAHELRTPLANLRGYLEALRDGVLEPDPDLLESLHEEVLLQQRIVDDLQDLALAEAGALTYHRADVDVRELLEACRTAHLARAEAAGVALRVEAPGPGAVLVRGDAGRLRQALGNLVGNAIRHTPPGGSVRLVLEHRDGRARIQVRDTGGGIPAADLPYLFDRFWRADAARGRATGGSGLGLSIARRFVTDHDGVIEVESEPGAGTVFTVVLPAPPPSSV